MIVCKAYVEECHIFTQIPTHNVNVDINVNININININVYRNDEIIQSR